MSRLTVLFSPDLESEEVANGARLLRDTRPEDELRFLLPDSLAGLELEGESATYRELPDPATWNRSTVDEVVYFGKDPRFFSAPRFIVPGSHGIDSVSYEIAQELVGFFNPQLTPGFISRLAESDLPLNLVGLNGSTRVEHP